MRVSFLFVLLRVADSPVLSAMQFGHQCYNSHAPTRGAYLSHPSRYKKRPILSHIFTINIGLDALI